MAEGGRLGLNPVETTMAKVERPLMPGGSDPLEEAAFALSTGGVSAPVKTPAGWKFKQRTLYPARTGPQP